MNQTNTIHSVDAGLIYAILKLSFSKQYKLLRFKPLCQECQNHFHWGPYQHYGCPQRASCNWINHNHLR